MIDNIIYVMVYWEKTNVHGRMHHTRDGLMRKKRTSTVECWDSRNLRCPRSNYCSQKRNVHRNFFRIVDSDTIDWIKRDWSGTESLVWRQPTKINYRKWPRKWPIMQQVYQECRTHPNGLVRSSLGLEYLEYEWKEYPCVVSSLEYGRTVYQCDVFCW